MAAVIPPFCLGFWFSLTSSASEDWNGRLTAVDGSCISESPEAEICASFPCISCVENACGLCSDIVVA